MIKLFFSSPPPSFFKSIFGVGRNYTDEEQKNSYFFSCFRYSDGVQPAMRKKMRLNVRKVSKPL